MEYSFLEKLIALQPVNKSPTFLDSNGFSLCSQELATGSYPEQDESRR
jgi:hypothetical protein